METKMMEKKNVPDDLRNKIEKDLKFEMKELGYI